MRAPAALASGCSNLPVRFEDVRGGAYGRPLPVRLAKDADKSFSRVGHFNVYIGAELAKVFPAPPADVDAATLALLDLPGTCTDNTLWAVLLLGPLALPWMAFGELAHADYHIGASLTVDGKGQIIAGNGHGDGRNCVEALQGAGVKAVANLRREAEAVLGVAGGK